MVVTVWPSFRATMAAVSCARPSGEAKMRSPDTVTFQLRDRTLRGPSTHYGAVQPGHAVVVLSSFGFYEIAING